MWALKWFTTVFGVGNIGKGGGTVAALILCIGWAVLRPDPSQRWLEIGFVILISGFGVWASGRMEPEWGKDSSRIVVDEVAGMAVALLGYQVSLPRIALAFALFRFFDIAKPLLIRRLERLPKGWGVMMDDLLAGIYSNLILHFLIAFNRI